MATTNIVDKDGNTISASDATVPSDRHFRGAWTLSGTTISEDLATAKDIFKDKIREVRKPLLEAEDVVYMKAMEADDATAKAASVTKKTNLRNAPAASAIADATTIAELKAAWDADLLGDSPYAQEQLMALTKIGKEGITGISNSSDANAITIDSSENVGIGITGPTVKLDIVDDGVQLRLANSTTGTGTSDGSRIQLSGNDLLLVNRESANMQFYTADTERMRILSSGGITFNGDTATANALDDYEEGTWTPIWSGSGSPTYGLQVGTYTKVGNVVHVSCYLYLFNKGSLTGALQLGGLPFTSVNTANNYTCGALWMNTTVNGRDFDGDYHLQGYIGPNASVFNIQSLNGDGTVTAIAGEDLNNTTDIMINVSYRI